MAKIKPRDSEFYYSEVFENLVEQLSTLPGIGKRSARRMAFNLFRRSSDELSKFSKSIEDVAIKRNFCKKCFSISDTELCRICSNNKRDKTIVCIVGEMTDLIPIEKSNVFNGLYHVLGGYLQPVGEAKEEDLFIPQLIKRIKEDNVKEVIIALSPTTEGESTANILYHKLKDYVQHITRLAQGIPVGSHLLFLDSITIEKAFKGRQKF